MMLNLRQKLKTVEGTTVITTFLFGIFVHMFGLVNVLHNRDNIVCSPNGYGAGVTSGRWFLEIIGNIFSRLSAGYNLPWVNGVTYILLLSISFGFLVNIFGVKNRKNALLGGMIFIVFPSLVEVIFFRFTAPYYGFAVFLSILAVWIIKKITIGRSILSMIFIALSLGIYQAYIPLTIGIFLLLLLKNTLKQEIEFKCIILHGFCYLLNVILGLFLHLAALRIVLMYENKELSGYKGMDKHLSIQELPSLLKRAIVDVINLPRRDYCYLAPNKTIKLIYLFIGIISIIIFSVILCNCKKNIKVVCISFLLAGAFLLSVNLIVVMCPYSSIACRMVCPFVLLLLMPIILLECMPDVTVKVVIGKILTFLLVSTICMYSYLANVSYVDVYYTNRIAENYLSGLVVQVRMTEKFDANKKWALIGEIKDPILEDPWDDFDVRKSSVKSLLGSFSRNSWITNYIGYSLKQDTDEKLFKPDIKYSVPIASDEEISILKTRPEYQEMPNWPTQGSIKVIDDIVVVKFSDE